MDQVIAFYDNQGGHRDDVTSIVFSPDGKMITSGSGDKTVRLWDAEKGEAIGTAPEGHGDHVTLLQTGSTSNMFSGL